MRTVYLDTETTGLSPSDSELVEIAIVDDDGHTLLDTLLRPARLTSWQEAERIHGITPAMTAGAPTLESVRAQIFEHVRGALVVIYNSTFDCPFLPGIEQEAGAIACAMRRYSPHRWVRLEQAARAVGHTWDGAAHRARADALACRSVWRWLQAKEPIDAITI